MKSLIRPLSLVAFACAAALPAAADYKPLDLTVRPEWKAKIAAASTNADALAVRKTHNRRLLVFCRTEGFCHGSSIVAGNEAIRLAGEKGAWRADFSDQYVDLLPESLARYDALVLMNTTNLKVEKYPFVSHAIIDFVKSGKGLAAIHAAVDGFNDAPELLHMIGGKFAGHPWGGGGTWSFRNDDPKNPLNAMFPSEPFAFSDEIYLQRAPFFSRQAEHLLLSLNLDDPKTGEALAKSRDMRRPDGMYPVAWTRRFGKGRIFYSSFGHDERAWCDARIVRHLFAGLQYALRDLDADDRPSDPEMLPAPPQPAK